MKIFTILFLSSIVLTSGQRYLKGRGNGNGNGQGNGNGHGNGNGNGNGMGTGTGSTIFLDVDPQTIRDEEKPNLIFMIEEEKLAHDVYAKFYDKFQLRIFRNIRNSEEHHESLVRQALQLHKIKDPTDEKDPGKFEDETLQTRYDSLVESGLENLTAALRAGVTIETEDISDLETTIQETTTAHLREMYERLLNASRNHLAAFNRFLDDTEQDP